MSRLAEGDLLKSLRDALTNVAGVGEVKNLAQKALEDGVDPLEIIRCMRDGLEAVGERYSAGEYFLSELIMAGIMASELGDMLKPYFAKAKGESLGRVVIGTVKGDLHDIGKNIVSTILSSIGFDVSDLGVDVSIERFVEAVRKETPDILAMSCLLTVAMDEMKNVIDALEEAGLRGMVNVLVGGRPITREFAEKIGADGYGRDAIEGMKVAKMLVAR